MDIENQIIVAKRMSLVYGGVWALFAAIQVGIGFSTNGDCQVNQRMPIYLSYHGLVNLLYGVIPPVFTFFGYNKFFARIAIFILWGAEGALIIYGMVEFYGTNSMLTSCTSNCRTCNPDALGTSIVTESFLLFMFLIALVVIFIYEQKRRCGHCHRSGSKVDHRDVTASQAAVASLEAAVEGRNNPQQEPPRLEPEPSAPPSYEEAIKN